MKRQHEQLPTARGNPLTRHQRDNLPLARVAAYQFNDNEPIMESTWPKVWTQRVRGKFDLRRAEAKKNLVLNGLMLEMLNAAKAVCTPLKPYTGLFTDIIVKNCTEPDVYIKVPIHAQTRKALKFVPWVNDNAQVSVK